MGHALGEFQKGDNLLSLYGTTAAFLNDAFLNAFVSVDTFLFVGGLLLAYLFYRDMDRNPRNIKSPVYWTLYYVHRILRLSPPYFFFLGFTVAMFPYFTRGPLQTTDSDIPSCKKYWWRNILYINNFFSMGNICMGHTWYLSVDMQIHIFAPLLLVPLFFSKIAGCISALLLLILSIGATYGTYYKYDFPATIMGLFLTSVDMTQTFDFFRWIYTPPWIRFTPYLVGVFAGYILHKYRNRNLRLHPVIVIAFWLASIAIGIGCVFGLYDYLQGKSQLSIFANASYYTWHRIGWSLALAWLVIACQHNMAGFLKNFMELSIWAPFGRLTYCAYLTHYFIIRVFNEQLRQPLHYVSLIEAYIHKGIPVFVVSYIFSFFWSCGFELPFGKIEKMGIDALFGRGRQTRSARAAVAKEKTPPSSSSSSPNGSNDGNNRESYTAPSIYDPRAINPPTYLQSSWNGMKTNEQNDEHL